ncbi:sensor histidine kinase [Limimaricola soesokkakensis]|nr:sensor histidine kinase [Limimaricola soesokkakensis]
MPYRDHGEGIGGVVVTIVDASSLAHAERQQQMLLAELNGRVRNMLTAAIDTARDTRQGAGSIEEFSDRLVGRLRSMAQAYGLLSEAEWTSVSLADMAQAELSLIDPSRLDISGPALELQPRQALPVGMILRELASNAARHGALATEEGRISLTWDRTGDRVTLGWHEIGGNGALDGTVNGYGLDLVAAQVEDELHRKVATDFSRDDLVFELSFSLER